MGPNAIADLRSAIDGAAYARNGEVVGRVLAATRRVRQKVCGYQKRRQRVEGEEARLHLAYASLLCGRISHSLLDSYWEDRSGLNRLRRGLAFKRRCGACLLCQLNPKDME